MKHFLAAIPNTLTLGNLACGLVGMVWLWQADGAYWAAICITAGMFFDFVDGLAARALGVSSEIGKQLDSLADMLTFGGLPALMLYHLTLQASLVGAWTTLFIYASAAALRLAKFNIDTRQSQQFIGLPTPAAAAVVVSQALASAIPAPTVLWAMGIVLAGLMLAPIPLFALKFKDFGWANNQVRYLYLGVCVLGIYLGQFAAIPYLVLLYIGVSLLYYKKPSEAP